MSRKKEEPEEEFVFEFYDEDYAKSLEGVEKLGIIEEYNEIDFEADLNEEQLEIVNNVQGPMLVIAGAGSGKTRTIVYSVNETLAFIFFTKYIILIIYNKCIILEKADMFLSK